MVRHRDDALAARVRRDAQAAIDAARVAAAYDNYLAAGVRLAHVQPCGLPWPPSLGDATPAPCQLLVGHDGDHRHRPPGAQEAITW